MNWPTREQIAEMESTEAYKHYWFLPAPKNAEQLAIIRALGDQAWKMRQEEDEGKEKRKYLPMPVKAEELPPAPVETTPPPAPVAKRKPQPAAPKEEEARGGSLFFLAALKRS